MDLQREKLPTYLIPSPFTKGDGFLVSPLSWHPGQEPNTIGTHTGKAKSMAKNKNVCQAVCYALYLCAILKIPIVIL